MEETYKKINNFNSSYYNFKCISRSIENYKSIEDLFNKIIEFLFSINFKISIKKEKKIEPKREKQGQENNWKEQESIFIQEEIRKQQIYPTVCLSSMEKGPRGILMYEGSGHFPDYELKEQVCNIGKDSRVQLLLEKETISRFHAKIEYLDHNYYIEDLNSTNGTYINDDLLIYKQHRKLEINDIIRFADIRYRFL